VCCSVCGRTSLGFDEIVSRLLRDHPDLVLDDETEWVFVCGECTVDGQCPCCSGEEHSDETDPLT
jgi:hypothetical protein